MPQEAVMRALLLVLVLVLSLGPGAGAQESDNLGIVVIDAEAVYRESTALRQLQTDIVTQREAFAEEIRGREEALRADSQKLAKQQGILSAAALAERRKALETRAAGLQRQVQERKAALDKQWSEGMRRVREILIEVSQEIAADRNADLVIEKSVIVLVKPEFDITSEALALLNKKLPELKPKAAGQ